MINKWVEFNEALKRGAKIQAKIDLIKDLSLELTDIGLEVEIHNGTWRDKQIGHILDASKCIIMFVKDISSKYLSLSKTENDLFHKKEILDFEETLKSFKMNYRAKSGNGQDGVIFYFDKQGNMSSGDVLKNYL